MTQQQRFCPICDRAFEEGEAVLRCEGCGVMHHPACWVRNNGCVTQTEHKQSPLAQAYSTARSMQGGAPHPGEGTRAGAAVADEPVTEWVMQPLAPVRPSRPTPPPAQHDDDEPFEDDDEGPMIGGGPVIGAGDRGREAPVIGAAPPPRPRAAAPPAEEPFSRPSAPRRYEPPAGEPAVRKPMPKVYGRHRILDYWYVPIAIVLAAAVALGVIWGAEQLTGGDDDDDTSPAGATSTSPAATGTATTAPATTSTPAGTPTPTPSVTSTAATGTFRTGEVVLVASPDECLNLRPAPGRTNQPIGCLDDASQVTVIGGPTTAEEITWWNVSTEQGDGWVAEDYLAKQP
ncbi:MAG: SH3 domain-containing protein [Dehalococcoidia bacterium]|nr:SH3 domain-containing protein [Dehalococcoidia bacterium]